MEYMSENINELAAALCQAQSEMESAKKGASNPFFKSKYADLSAVIDAIKQPFYNNGIAYTQLSIPNDDNHVTIRTMLIHKSGQWIASDVSLRPVKGDPQANGSAITYARRYGLQSIAGLSAEDDDGNAASRKPTHNSQKKQTQTYSVDDIKKTKKKVADLLSDPKIPEDDRRKGMSWLPNVNDMPKLQSSIERLEKRIFEADKPKRNGMVPAPINYSIGPATLKITPGLQNNKEFSALVEEAGKHQDETIIVHLDGKNLKTVEDVLRVTNDLMELREK